jgi:hypothetical protein
MNAPMQNRFLKAALSIVSLPLSARRQKRGVRPPRPVLQSMEQAQLVAPLLLDAAHIQLPRGADELLRESPLYIHLYEVFPTNPRLVEALLTGLRVPQLVPASVQGLWLNRSSDGQMELYLDDGQIPDKPPPPPVPSLSAAVEVSLRGTEEDYWVELRVAPRPLQVVSQEPLREAA